MVRLRSESDYDILLAVICRLECSPDLTGERWKLKQRNALSIGADGKQEREGYLDSLNELM